MTTSDDLVQQGHRGFAAQAFNAVWDLLLSDRSVDDDDRMVDLAHASYWHWTQVEGEADRQLATGSWQLSRVYAVLGDAERARHFGERSLNIATASPVLGAFNVAYAHEALGSRGNERQRKAPYGQGAEWQRSTWLGTPWQATSWKVPV